MKMVFEMAWRVCMYRANTVNEPGIFQLSHAVRQSLWTVSKGFSMVPLIEAKFWSKEEKTEIFHWNAVRWDNEWRKKDLTKNVYSFAIKKNANNFWRSDLKDQKIVHN